MTAPFPPFPKEDWGGDSTAELDRRVASFPLTPDSHIWIAGGFYGNQIRHFARTYQCHIRSFEPQPDIFQKYLAPIDYPKLTLHNFGLGERDGTFEMCKPGTDACSFITQDSQVTVPGPYITAAMVDTARFLRQNKIANVDLFLMNIEGYEFVLLPYLMQKKLIERFDLLMVQFHLGWEGGAAYPQIRADLSKTHELWWEYRPPAWVVWKRKEVIHGQTR